jgi:hypothetical protein
MRHLSTAGTVLLVAAIAACSSSTTADVNAPAQTNTTTTQREVGKATMKIGDSIVMGELRLTFRSVEGDSRCPIDAACVWAGDAEIALKIEQANRAAVAALHTMLEPKKTEWNGYTISLVSLTPVRRAADAVNPEDYRAEVVVTR